MVCEGVLHIGRDFCKNLHKTVRNKTAIKGQ